MITGLGMRMGNFAPWRGGNKSKKCS